MELDVHWAGADPRRVGRLYQDPRGTVFFEYDSAWRAGGIDLSPLYRPNTTPGTVTTPTPGFGGLHGLFQDALPDWWGERLMRRMFENKGISTIRTPGRELLLPLDRNLSCQRGGTHVGARFQARHSPGIQPIPLEFRLDHHSGRSQSTSGNYYICQGPCCGFP